MKQIISTLAQRPRIVDIIVGLIIIVGLLTVSSLRSNFLPPEPIAFVNVNVVYRGASPQEVEEEVVNKIEDNLDGISGVLRVTSTSSESFGRVRVELTEDFDANEALQEVTNAV
ncbi:MAG: efflux RND transporter permease subunit, partial [Bacteroidota bacterium]